MYYNEGKYLFEEPQLLLLIFFLLSHILEEIWQQWIWGGFAVDNATLTRFFSLHFLLPFVVAGLRIVHLLSLHQTGRNNPLGINRNFDKVSFYPYFSTKDVFVFVVLLMILGFICFPYPWIFYSRKSFGYTCVHSARVIFFNNLRYFTIYSK